jgi:alkylation response protein AidB-like acyl-CoA dehydrogenase
MNFDFSKEQDLLRETARQFLETECGIPYSRQMMDDERGYTAEIWEEIAKLGWQALAVPEDRGGHGQGLLELVVVLEEMGRLVHPGPFFSSAVLATALLLSTEDKELLPALANGERIATVAIAEEGGWDPDAFETTIEGDRVRGSKAVVTDGSHADILLVVARGGDVAVVERSDSIQATSLTPLDATRKMSDVRFDGAKATRVIEGARDAVETALDWARVGLCAEAVGGAERALEMAVDYAKHRVQFDRPIGSFQAVQHKLADMLRLVELSRVATHYAAWSLQERQADAHTWASLAKAYVSSSYAQVAADSIQVHGGIGFTWEHDAHLYYKRAKAIEYFLGDVASTRERVAQLVL